MLTGIVKSAFRSSLAETYDPRAVVARVAGGIAAFASDRFVTLLAARISAGDNTVEFVNAGHEGGFLSTGGDLIDLESTGPLISPALPDLAWEVGRVPWNTGATLLLYTDGILEASNEEEIFGAARIGAALRRFSGGSADLLKSILAEVEAFTGPRPPVDDMTLLTVGRT